MTAVLLRKLLRDLRVPLVVVALLLGGFQCLWTKITQRITEEIIPSIVQHLPLPMLVNLLFQGPGKLIQTLIGGESIDLARPLDVLTIGYVHPLTQAILCVWAVGRAAGAIAGEIDRGTMELLLAQPVPRRRVIFAHLGVDALCMAVLCLAMWAGDWVGLALFGRIEFGPPAGVATLRVDPRALLRALVCVAALLFAVGGYTMWISAAGRFRGRVLGVAVVVTLVQFLVNVVGQLWDAAAWLRPLTVFYYYQPQQVILKRQWAVDLAAAWGLNAGPAVNGVLVLVAVGAAGYGLALWTFCRRDLPAPL